MGKELENFVKFTVTPERNQLNLLEDASYVRFLRIHMELSYAEYVDEEKAIARSNKLLPIESQFLTFGEWVDEVVYEMDIQLRERDIDPSNHPPFMTFLSIQADYQRNPEAVKNLNN